MKRILVLIVLGGFFMPCFSRQDTTYPKKIYTTAEITVPPQIDGWINDESWNAVPWEGSFQMHEPYDNRPPTQETRFKVVFDRENIYVAMRAFDSSPDSIVDRLTRRDDLDGDWMAFQFDSYHDLQTAFTFVVSAAGSRMDAYMTSDGNNEDQTWNPVWWVKTRIDDEGWTLEAKIPFSQLRFDRESGGVWGFQLARMVFRNNENSIWQPISKEAPGWVHLIGEIHGLGSITPKKQAEVSPYFVAGSQWFEKEPEDPFRADGYDRIGNAGLDAKVGITNNFTLDMTVNPDFGQVEADPSRVNLTAFETFFQEQRPFFVEGNNLFDYDMAIHNMDNLFYSRRIGRKPHHYPELESGEYARVPRFTKILGAAKVTGKTREGLSLGIMESVTARETAEIDYNGERRSETVEPLTNYLAGRAVKEFNKGNTILGGIFTSTNRFTNEDHLDYLHSSALTGGIDFQQFFAERSYQFTLSAYTSQVNGSEKALLNTQYSSVHYFQRPDTRYITLDSTRTSLSGYGGNLSFGKQSGRLIFRAFLNFNSPGLELNDLGFLTSTDEIVEIFWVGYRFYEPFSIFRNMNLNLNQWSGWDFGGRHQVVGFNVNGHMQFKNFWNAGFFYGMNSDALANFALRGGPRMRLPGDINMNLFGSTSSRKKLVAEAGVFHSRGTDDSGYAVGSEIEVSYKPISNINVSLSPGFQHRIDELQYVDQVHIDGEERFLFGSIDQKTLSMSLRLDLIITPELTLQYWGQPFIATGNYSEFKYISDPEAERFTDRFHTFAPDEMAYQDAESNYVVTEQGSSLSYSFGNPDFNVKEFLSNLVFRWEYRPGSYLYLVWSQTRSGYDPYGRFDFRNDFSDMWGIHPTDAVMLKLSYRIGR